MIQFYVSVQAGVFLAGKPTLKSKPTSENYDLDEVANNEFTGVPFGHASSMCLLAAVVGLRKAHGLVCSLS